MTVALYTPTLEDSYRQLLAHALTTEEARELFVQAAADPLLQLYRVQGVETFQATGYVILRVGNIKALTLWMDTNALPAHRDAFHAVLAAQILTSMVVK